MKTRIILLAFALVLFLASPVFSMLVGANTLSAEEVAARRTEYPYQYMANGLADYEFYPTRCFSREAQRADTLVYCEVLELTTAPLYTTPAYVVRVIDDSRNLFPKGSTITLHRSIDGLTEPIAVGDRFVVPIHRFFEKDREYAMVRTGEMFYVTDDGYVLSYFDESDWLINYDQKVHSGMTVQALLRKYIAWDGVPSVHDFENWDKANEWLKFMGYPTND